METPTSSDLARAAIQPTFDLVDKEAAPHFRRLLQAAKEHLTNGRTEKGLAVMADVYRLRIAVMTAKFSLFPFVGPDYEKGLEHYRDLLKPGASTMAEQLDLAWGEINSFERCDVRTSSIILSREAIEALNDRNRGIRYPIEIIWGDPHGKKW